MLVHVGLLVVDVALSQNLHVIVAGIAVGIMSEHLRAFRNWLFSEILS